jgi:hypothetical protein
VCKLLITTKLEELATKDTDGAFLTPSNHSWSISRKLPADKTGLQRTGVHGYRVDLQLTGTEIDIKFTDSATWVAYFIRESFVVQSDINAESGKLLTGSFSFTQETGIWLKL